MPQNPVICTPVVRCVSANSTNLGYTPAFLFETVLVQRKIREM